MKKFITLALALVMVLGLAAPALAYTTNVAPAQGVSPYTVRIYMVEYANVDKFSGWITMPPSDRGYATNEVIAFIGELTVPSKKDVYKDYYRRIQFKTKNVSLNVVDNFGAASTRSWFLANTADWVYGTTPAWGDNDPDFTKLYFNLANTYDANVTAASGAILKKDNQKVYKWLGFGKVTGDDATVTFALTRNAGFVPVATATYNSWNQPYGTGIIPVSAQNHKGNAITEFAQVLVVNEKYLVFKDVTDKTGPTAYYVYENANGTFGVGIDAAGVATEIIPKTDIGDLLFKIETVNDIGKTDRLWIYPRGNQGVAYRIHVEPSVAYLDVIYNSETGLIPAGKKHGDQLDPTSSAYKTAVDFYNEYVVDAFGFDAWNRGNLLVDSDWGKIADAAWDISDTVDVEPWTPYVAVPENIVTDPPKTGDASVLGFVMIVLAAAAAVVVKKVRA